MNPASGTGGAPYIVVPISVVQSCSDQARKALGEALDLIFGEATANLPKPWPGKFHVKVRLQDPASGRTIRDDLADCKRGERRLWEQKSEL